MLPWFRGPLDRAHGYEAHGAVLASKVSGQRCGGHLEKHCVFFLFFPCLLLLTCDESRMREEMSFGFAHCAICIYKSIQLGIVKELFPQKWQCSLAYTVFLHQFQCFWFWLTGALNNCLRIAQQAWTLQALHRAVQFLIFLFWLLCFFMCVHTGASQLAAGLVTTELVKMEWIHSWFLFGGTQSQGRGICLQTCMWRDGVSYFPNKQGLGAWNALMPTLCFFLCKKGFVHTGNILYRKSR